MTTIVISAVNLRKGGTLTILRQCLEYLSSIAGKDYRVVALVHKVELAHYSNIEYIELPWCIEGWHKRLWCEYITMNRISKEIGNIDLWLSLHDATPKVQAKRQAVYCHAPFPFFKIKWSNLFLDYKIPIFGLLTKYIYKVNQKKNKYLIVQQEWLREAFHKMFRFPIKQIILARADTPSVDYGKPLEVPIDPQKYLFFFAATPDVHKDFQTLCEATRILSKRTDPNKFEVVITISGQENKYSTYLYKKWGRTKGLIFAGLMDKPTLYAYYHRADCFVFPSRIETWGLPISEYSEVHQGKRPMILSDLPYAQETSQGSKQVAFFESGNPEALATLMEQVIKGDMQNFSAQPKAESLASPHAKNWEELFSLLLAGL